MQDLSNLGEGWPSFGNSMNGTNMITPKTHDQLGAPGSPSEATADVEIHDRPELQIPPVKSLTKNPESGGVPSTAPSWKKLT